MRRHLVQTNEAAQHPFRQYLPVGAMALSTQDDDGTAGDEAGNVLPEPRARAIMFVNDETDWKLFLLSFIAFFTAISAFIA